MIPIFFARLSSLLLSPLPQAEGDPEASDDEWENDGEGPADGETNGHSNGLVVEREKTDVAKMADIWFAQEQFAGGPIDEIDLDEEANNTAPVGKGSKASAVRRSLK